MASTSAKRSTNLGAMALVLVVVIGVWLLNGRDPGTGTDDRASNIDTGPVASAPASAPPTSRSPSPSEPTTGRTLVLDPDSGLPLVDAADLPGEARDTLELIDAGGPFPYDEDGGRFGNYEGLLPDEPSGYYAEYTVETPGSPDRGARRIIAGDGGELYWTDDHYASFSRVAR